MSAPLRREKFATELTFRPATGVAQFRSAFSSHVLGICRVWAEAIEAITPEKDKNKHAFYLCYALGKVIRSLRFDIPNFGSIY
jgi:hypothetical protein